MGSVDVFPFIERLWSQAQAAGITVHYVGNAMEDGWFRPNNDLEDGPVREPEIAIVRTDAQEDQRDVPEPSRYRNGGVELSPQELQQELFTLAHEYGHYLSWKQETPAAEYKQYRRATRRWALLEMKLRGQLSDLETGAMKVDGREFAKQRSEVLRKDVADNDKERIFAEERRAWDLGRRTLDGLGFPHLAAYEEYAARGYSWYPIIFGMAPLPEE